MTTTVGAATLLHDEAVDGDLQHIENNYVPISAVGSYAVKGTVSITRDQFFETSDSDGYSIFLAPGLALENVKWDAPVYRDPLGLEPLVVIALEDPEAAEPTLYVEQLDAFGPNSLAFGSPDGPYAGPYFNLINQMLNTTRLTPGDAVEVD